MANTLYNFKTIPDTIQENTFVMIVYETLNGEALSLINTAGKELATNFIHASSVPNLIIDDKVIVQKIANDYIITHKLRNPGDKPTIGFDVNEDGSLSLLSEVRITFKTLNAKIDISANGKIEIDGKEIYSISKGMNRLQGTSVELN